MQQGSLTVITGCMFAGKTTTLIQHAEKAKKEGKVIKIYYPIIDERYSKNFITSHNNLAHIAYPLSLNPVTIEWNQEDSIYIDEAQFFEPSIVSTVKKLRASGIQVVIGGLDKDYRGEAFASVPDLIAMADQVIELEATCAVCGKPARFTQRLINGQYAKKNDETIVIGGSDSYEPRCKDCFVKPE